MTRRFRTLSISCSATGAMALVFLTVESVLPFWTGVISGRLGLAVDDAWIHQVFARNSTSTGILVLNMGMPSTGVSAPLWTVQVTIVYRLSHGCVGMGPTVSG